MEEYYDWDADFAEIMKEEEFTEAEKIFLVYFAFLATVALSSDD